MRYTCNKKAYPDFEKDCKKCPSYDPCVKGGKWCFVAVAALSVHEPLIADAGISAMVDFAAPVMVKHDYRNVKIAEGTTVTIDLEEIKERLNRDFYKQIGATFLPGG